ncbi:MAG TPA: hypothetical protein VLB90_00720 [Pseudomonadales bacterium]|nr:hypothetical protein [Pseudomonadales bacterium]
MQSVVKLFFACLFFSAFSSANAYYLENALPGKVTVSVTGACAIPATTVNAYLATVNTDEHVLIGRGIVTAAGKLIALEEKRSDVSYSHLLATGEKSATDYVDYVGDTLHGFLIANGVNCNIETLEPDVDSKAVYHWNAAGGTLNLKAGFGGYEKQRCFSGVEQERCLAQRIRGVIRFKGAWQSGE